MGYIEYITCFTHTICFTMVDQAEKALVIIKEKIEDNSYLTKPEKDQSCSIHFATDDPLTEQQREILFTLGAVMMILDNEE